MRSVLPLFAFVVVACGTPEEPLPGDTDVTEGNVPGPTGVTGPEAPACGDFIEVDPGIGLSTFTPIADGDPVYVVTGPQALWHIDIGGDVYGTSNQAVTVRSSLYWPDGGQTLSPSDPEVVSVGLIGYDADACTGVFYGQRAMIAPEFDPGMPLPQFICSLMGQELELTITVSDLITGVTNEVTTLVVARPDDTTQCN